MAVALRAIRKALGLSQRELAEKSGITKQAICNLERGFRKGSLRSWDRLAAALRVDYRRLREDDAEPPAPLAPVTNWRE